MLLTALLFIVLGILIKYFKMYNLIAGYNTMSADKKATYDIKKIAALFGNVFFYMALIIILGYMLSQITENDKLESISFYTALITGIPYLLVKSNSNNYKS